MTSCLPSILPSARALLVPAGGNLLGSLEKRAEALQRLLELPWVIMVYPGEKIDAVAAGKKDNMVLECAVPGEARYIVTVDSHLFDLSLFRGIEIVSAQLFLEILNSA